MRFACGWLTIMDRISCLVSLSRTLTLYSVMGALLLFGAVHESEIESMFLSVT